MAVALPEKPESRTSLFLVLTILAWLLPATVFVAGNPGFIGADPYFHIQLSRSMAGGGLGWRVFPWATESTWTLAWFDKDWLFHLALAPFARWDPVLGGKLFSLLAVGFVAVGTWCAGRALGLSRRQAAFWICLLPWTCYGLFWLRLAVCRPHVLSIGLFCFSLAFLISRRPVALAITAFAYTLAHASHWQLPGLALLYDIMYVFLDRVGRRRPRPCRDLPMFAFVLAGVAAGTMAHPGFPLNVRGLFVQNVLVPFSAGTGVGATARIGELQPAGWRLSWLLLPVFITAALAVAGYLWQHRRPGRTTLFLGVGAVGYLALAAFALRFLDYAVPVVVLCLAAAWLELGRAPAPVPAGRLGLIAVPIVLIFGYLGFRQVYERYCGQSQITHARAGAWLREHLQPGEIVFATRFHDNGVLWFHAPDQRFLVFLDPIFMRRHAPERYELWEQIRHGRHPDPVAAITGVFGSRAVFVIADPRQTDPGKNAELNLVRQLEAAGAECVCRNDQTGARIYLLSTHPLPRIVRPWPHPAIPPGE